MRPKVIHQREAHLFPDAVYVGRPSKFGNPYVVGRDGSRTEVIRKFVDHINADPVLLKDVQSELRGKILSCWCKPKACHGDVLLEIANKKPSLFKI